MVWCATVSLKAVIHSRRKAERKLKSICRQLSQTHRVANRGHQPCAGSATEWDPSARGLPTRTGPRGPRGISRTLPLPQTTCLQSRIRQLLHSQAASRAMAERGRPARKPPQDRPPVAELAVPGARTPRMLVVILLSLKRSLMRNSQ